MENKQERQENSILALGVVLALFLAGGILFDFYYDLNDDVLIKDIVSGAYTGVPEGRNVQMLYLLGMFLGLFYRSMPRIPWFGLFLCLCHGMCFFFLAYRSLAFTRERRQKLLLVLAEFTAIGSLFLWEMVYVQYSVTCGLLAATACFLFYTTPHHLETKEFLKRNVGTILLVLLAFFIRTEMLLLMLPFIGITGVFHWSSERQIFSKENFQKYLGLVGILTGGFCLGLLGDKLAYDSSEWQKFLSFFDARTRVYDFTWYPAYEEAEEFYEEIGVSEGQYQLIATYNFGLDERIDEHTLSNIAAYGEKQRNQGSLGDRMKEAVWGLRHRMFSNEDAPYSYFVLLGYFLLIVLAVGRRDFSYGWKIPLLLMGRSVSWLYVILAQRVPRRISHPLYYVELAVLSALIIREAQEQRKEKGFFGRRGSLLVSGLFLVLGLVFLPAAFREVQSEQSRRELVNENQLLFDSFARSHPENYYYLDVYSTVDFSEQIFHNVNNTQKNYDIPGGWLSKSPLQRKAISHYTTSGVTNPGEALLEENVYFVIEKNGDTQFLTDFYKSQGIEVKLEPEAAIGSGDNPLLIYQVMKE